MALNFEVKKSEIPVIINGLEFAIPIDDASIIAYTKAKETLTRELGPVLVAYEKLSKIPEEVGENGNRMVSLMKQALKPQFDLLLGEGSFDRIYHSIPDCMALSLLWGNLTESFAAELHTMTMKRKTDSKKQAAKYAKK